MATSKVTDLRPRQATRRTVANALPISVQISDLPRGYQRQLLEHSLSQMQQRLYDIESGMEVASMALDCEDDIHLHTVLKRLCGDLLKVCCDMGMYGPSELQEPQA